MRRILKQVPGGGISFMELLLNENLCEGEIGIETALVAQSGGVNAYLETKQKYELLLRMVQDMHVELYHTTEEMPQKQYMIFTDDDEDLLKAHGWKTDCYVIGRYSGLLRENGIFDLCLEEMIREAEAEGRVKETIAYLEQMVGHAQAYWNIEEGSMPILIYKEGRDNCDVLNTFSEQLGRAFERTGKKVILYDCQKDGVQGWQSVCMEKHFQAVIGMQSAVFSLKIKNGSQAHYLHEYMYGPKYNYIFDHPVMMYRYMEHDYKDFYLLTHDADYAAFAERFLKKKTFLFPLAGIEDTKSISMDQRPYDITFVGVYGNYWKEILSIHQMDRRIRFLANKFLLKMRRNTELTGEKALAAVLAEKKIVLSDDEFLKLLYELRAAIHCVMYYYRDRVLRVLLDSGFFMDVFGDSWQNCPLSRYPNLRCHPTVNVKESIEIWRKSKLSLNIMSWHKRGFTERMAQIMLEKTVLVTDVTGYMEENYGENDLLMFRLEEVNELPGQIRRLLSEPGLRKKIAENGWRKTVKQHTWEKRAGQFLEILQERFHSL